MKNIVFLISIGIVFTSCFKVKNPSNGVSSYRALTYIETVYKEYLTTESVFLDVNGEKISKKEFAIRSFDNDACPGLKNIDTFQIIMNEDQGTIRNPEKIFEILDNYSQVEYNKTKPIVIFFHPGIDGCSEGIRRDTTRERFYSNNMQSRIKSVANTLPFYFYKASKSNIEDLGSLWEEDPLSVFESTFFPYHVPCGSFAIMDVSGNYYVNHGESTSEVLIAMLIKIMNEN